MAAVKPIFAGGWMKLRVVLDDGATDVIQVDAEAYRSIVYDQDQGTAKKVVDGYKEAYGRDKSIVSLEVIGEVTDVDGNNNVIDDVVDEESQMVDELGSHDQPINSMKCTGGHTWTHEAVLLLIDLFGKNKDKFASSCFKQKDIWQCISEKMKDSGHTVDGVQCNEKFRSLKYRHKVITDSNAKSGRGRRSWQFYEAMEEVMAGDPAVRPIKVVASALTAQERCPPKRQLFTATPIRPQNEEHNEQSTPGDQTPHTRKRRRVQQEPPEWFQAFRTEQNERMDRLEAANNSLIKIAQERNDILKTLVNHLTKNK
ncbi:uncharacterized protein LOC128211016 [Mya arenaria]|uniref:uncharacterized protein LOC128211016 n=1 Tax=Mya arenaria TaxID=6604 RepID=UPI0022E28E2E|nr:uncharacterized protein LOC128211016 [Mya arenaria]